MLLIKITQGPFSRDGTSNDVEVSFDENGNVDGFVTTGLGFDQISQDDGISCTDTPEGFCGTLPGFIAKVRNSPEISTY